MPNSKSKKYFFALTFGICRGLEFARFQHVVSHNARVLRRYNCRVDTDNIRVSQPDLIATVEVGAIEDLGLLMRVCVEDLLDCGLTAITVVFNNSLLPSLDEPQTELGQFKYRSGEWTQRIQGFHYIINADPECRTIKVTRKLQNQFGLLDWWLGVARALTTLDSVISATRQAKNLSYAMSGTDGSYMIAAQGRLMTSIGKILG